MKESKKIIFIVLCYKNTIDLVCLLNNLANTMVDYAVIIVNSYYNENTNIEFCRIANENRCYFLSIDNKGYGYGNNLGIAYAIKNFEFEYLCICNPDIQIIKLPTTSFSGSTNKLVAPDIITRKGKHQNPYYIIDCKVVMLLKKVACKKKSRYIFLLAVGLNKIIRIIFKWFMKKPYKIFACHGACFFIGRDAIMSSSPLFNEKMFLYNEEEHVANKMRVANIPILFDNRIKVFHLEDGSSDEIIKNGMGFKLLCESYNELIKFWNSYD